MNNVEYFLRKHNACRDGSKFALQYSTMAEVWDALMLGKPNVRLARDWALWIISLGDEILSGHDRVVLASKFVDRVKSLIYEDSIKNILNMLNMYKNGDINDEDLEYLDGTLEIVCAARDAVLSATISSALFSAAESSILVALKLNKKSDRDFEIAEQLEILRSIQNPFMEEGKIK